MSQQQQNSAENQQEERPNPPRPHYSTASTRRQTATDSRPSSLQHNSSNAPNLGRFDSIRIAGTNQSRPQNDRSNTATTGMRPMASIGRAPTNRTTRENVNEEPNRRPEKKQRQTVDVDNDYFALNPWYNEQKSKPVFGLGAPLPHTVRHGMWWGRGDLRKSLYKVDEDQEGEAVDFKDGQGLEEDSEGSQVPLRSQGSNQRRDPDHFQTTIEGRPVNMKRVQTSEANQFLDNQDQPHESREHDQRGRAPVNEHGLEFSGQHGEQHQFGLQDGLPPLQKLDTSESTQSQKEENEIERREQEAEKEFYDQYRNPIARLRARYPQAPAEFVATFIYLLIGLCVNLSVATSQEGTGSFETQAWGWGFAVMIGIYIGGGVSGSHLSPTVSISLAVYRGFPWKHAIIYILMQLLAGLAAGGVAYAIYYDAIQEVDPGLTLELTGKALFPQGPKYSTATGFFNDFAYMAIFVLVVFAVGDDQNSPPGQGMSALVVGLAGFVTMIGLGYNTGLGISPARDLGPRLVGLWAGYDEAFASGYWAYGSWGASIGGALTGGLLYDLCIFQGGESPVNYRWPQPGDIKWKAKEKRDLVKDKIHDVA